MDIRRISAVFFSPTGATKNILEVMTCGLPLQSDTIDITSFSAHGKSLDFAGNVIVFFGIPVYGGRVPAPAVERIKKLRGDSTPSVLVVTFGNRAYDDALLELQMLTEANGFVTVAAGAFITEHSIMHSVAHGRPDENDKMEISAFGKAAWEKAQNATDASGFAALNLPGNEAYREYGGVPLKPKATRKCTKCGICAANCPVGAIPADRPSSTDNRVCISCMRCMKICPVHARKLNCLTLSVAEGVFYREFNGRKESETFF